MKEKNTIKLKANIFFPQNFEQNKIKKTQLSFNQLLPEKKNKNVSSLNKKLSLKTPVNKINRNFFNQNNLNCAFNENIPNPLIKSHEFQSKNNKISSVFMSGNLKNKKYKIKNSKEDISNHFSEKKSRNSSENNKYKNFKYPINIVNLHMNLTNHQEKENNKIFTNSMPISNLHIFPKLNKLDTFKHHKNHSLYGMDFFKIKYELGIENKKEIVIKKIESNSFIPKIKLKPIEKNHENILSDKLNLNINNASSEKIIINFNNIKMNSSPNKNKNEENNVLNEKNLNIKEKEFVKTTEDKKEIINNNINDNINENENIKKTENIDDNIILEKKEKEEPKQENLNIISFVNDLFSQKIPSRKNISSINLSNPNSQRDREKIILEKKTSDDLFLKNLNSTIKNYYFLTQAGKSEEGPKINQDSILEILNINNNNNFSIFGVFDGHGNDGHLISQFIVKTMKNILLNDEKLKQISKNTNEIYSYLKENNYEFIRDLISKSENLLFNNYEEESKYSGTTCNLVIIIGKKVICANIGDSRAFMIKNHKTIIELSSDQKPDNPSEKERIESKGGEIRQYIENNEPIGPMRVFKKNENYPGIAMARSIGDKLADLIGVISEPEIKEFDIDINCKYIICGSDGIFEFLTNEKIAHIINKYYKKNEPKECCDVIIKKSVELWNKYDTVVDDHSIIIIFFNQ
jgi:serine/threonine protein phosphatase PrpC